MTPENRQTHAIRVLNRVEKESGKPLGGDAEARFRAQKVIYLAQQTDAMPEAYEFDKYFRGPYSTALAEDLQELEYDAASWVRDRVQERYA